ncbi:hypothetical protein BH23THE1_BH23THE1_35430 [soil metagenome]
MVDYYNNRIQKFDSEGNFLTKWGSEGSGDGQFILPTGIAIDSTGNVYVVDYNNHRIQVFKPASNDVSVNDLDGDIIEFSKPDNTTSLREMNSSSQSPTGITDQL